MHRRKDRRKSIDIVGNIENISYRLVRLPCYNGLTEERLPLVVTAMKACVWEEAQAGLLVYEKYLRLSL